MLKLIIGPAGSGKSFKLVQELVENAVKNPEKRFFIIVPEQFTLRTQQRVVRFHPAHACMNIDVVSFDRLARVALAKLGKDVMDILDDTGKALILKSVIEENKEDLVIYKNKTHLAGFTEEVKSVVTEFKQYGIDDDTLFLMQESALEKGSRQLYAKLQDIRLLLRKFNEKISDKYTTSEEVLGVFAKEIPNSEFIKDAEFYLDGFTGFTPVQYKVLKQLMKAAANIVCTVTITAEKAGRECPDYDLFSLSSHTYCKLKKLAADNDCPCEADEVLAGRYVERMSEGTESKQLKTFLYNGRNLHDEVSFAAAEIRRLVKEKDLRYRDIGILTADMESYYSEFRNVFEDAGIPVFIDHKSEISDNQLVRFIKGAIEMASKNYSYDSVFDFLKTGLADLSVDEVNLLENYCLEFNIRGIKAWKEDFVKNRTIHGGAPAWDLEEINGYRVKALKTFRNFEFSVKKEMNAEDYASVIKKLLEDNAAEKKINDISAELEECGELSRARQYDQICEQIMELLEKISRLMKGKMLSLEEFKGILESGIDEIKIGIIPPSIDEVTAGDLVRTRLGAVKVLFMVGVNDGKIPPSGNPSGIFTQREREFLKKEYDIAPTALENLYTQRFYLYMAFAKPEDSLYITWANETNGTDPLNPSYVLDELDQLISETEVTVLDGKKRDDDNGTSYEKEWKKAALLKLSEEMRTFAEYGNEPDEKLLGMFAQADWPQLLQIINGAFCSNKQTNLDKDVALALYGDVLKGSVSRFESFFECPYRHFLNYGIRLEKRREYEIAVTDLGTVYHDTLEHYAKRLEEEGLSFRTVSDEDSARITRECAQQAIESMENDAMSSTSRNEFFKERITEIAEKTTEVLREHVKAGLFEPAEFEMYFEGEADDVSFRGKIDRIDLYEAGDIFVKIIDYKSGSKKFDIKDIYSGVQLQLAAYMKRAIKKIEEKHPGKNVRPGGIYYYLINDKYEKADDVKENSHRMSGVSSCAPGVIEAIDQTIDPSVKKSSNIVEVKYDKNGQAAGSIANEQEFYRLMDFVDGKISEAGKRIKEGEISIAPYKDSKHEGCTYCDYKDICRFEAGKFGNDWNRPEEKSDKELEGMIYGRN